MTTTTTQHTHKAITAKRQTYGWTYCVNSDRCHGDSSAHGGVMFIDHCTCGAVRRTESNGTAKVYGIWTGGKYDRDTD